MTQQILKNYTVLNGVGNLAVGFQEDGSLAPIHHDVSLDTTYQTNVAIIHTSETFGNGIGSPDDAAVLAYFNRKPNHKLFGILTTTEHETWTIVTRRFIEHIRAVLPGWDVPDEYQLGNQLLGILLGRFKQEEFTIAIPTRMVKLARLVDRIFDKVVMMYQPQCLPPNSKMEISLSNRDYSVGDSMRRVIRNSMCRYLTKDGECQYVRFEQGNMYLNAYSPYVEISQVERSAEFTLNDVTNVLRIEIETSFFLSDNNSEPYTVVRIKPVDFN